MNQRLLSGFLAAVLMAAGGTASATRILDDSSNLSAQGTPTQMAGGTHAAGSGGQYPVDIFVRGSFNGSGLDDAMGFDGSVYSATVDLTVGGWDFRIASEDWVTVDLGAGDSGDSTVVLDSARLIGTGGDLFLEIAAAGYYTFTFNTSAGMNSPILTVSSATVMREPTILALIGLPLVWLAISRRRKTRGF